APVGEMEITLAQIWSEVLQVERVGRHDQFFELGGHSLLAVKLIERMRQQGLIVDVRAFFTAPTLEGIAALVPLVSFGADDLQIVGAAVGGASNVQDVYPLAPLQEGILFHHLVGEAGDPYVVGALLSFDSRA